MSFPSWAPWSSWSSWMAWDALDFLIGLAITAILKRFGERLGYFPRISTLGWLRWVFRGWRTRSPYDLIRRAVPYSGKVQPRSTRADQVEVSPEQMDWLSRQAIGTLVAAEIYPDGVYWFFDQSDNLGRRFLLEEHRIVQIKTTFNRSDGVRFNAVSEWDGKVEPERRDPGADEARDWLDGPSRRD